MSISQQTLKRIAKEQAMLQKHPVKEFHAVPTSDNALEWHFTMLGPPDSPYAEGVYHGRILIPHEYPFKPPDVVLLTPNGRFELDKRICLSVSSYHPEHWHPTWGVQTVLNGLREFMLTPGNNAIGAIEYPNDVRLRLAQESKKFVCPHCKVSVGELWETDMSKRPSLADTPSTPSGTPLMTPMASGSGGVFGGGETTPNGTSGALAAGGGSGSFPSTPLAPTAAAGAQRPPVCEGSGGGSAALRAAAVAASPPPVIASAVSPSPSGGGGNSSARASFMEALLLPPPAAAVDAAAAATAETPPRDAAAATAPADATAAAAVPEREVARPAAAAAARRPPPPLQAARPPLLRRNVDRGVLEVHLPAELIDRLLFVCIACLGLLMCNKAAWVGLGRLGAMYAATGAGGVGGSGV